MNLFSSESSPKTPPPSPPSKRRSRILFRSASGGASESANTTPTHSPSRAKTAPAAVAAPATPPAPAPAPAPASAPSSAPSTPSKRTQLGIANVANIFVKMRRASDQARSPSKPWHIHSSSGPEPQSHPGVLEGAAAAESEGKALRVPVQHRDVFICHDAVNVVQLLRATRNALMEVVEEIGGNALVDERWDCTICGPKHRRNGSFKVEISYSASATRSERADPHRPVALDKVKGVPGLMTVTKRIA